jgi:hypothetical protein
MPKEPLFAFTGIFTLRSKVKFEMLSPLLIDIRVLLHEHIQTEKYGTGLQSINIKYVTAEKKHEIQTKFEKGTFYPKNENYIGFVVFGQNFASLSESDRKITIQNLLFEILADVEKKLKKHSVNFDAQSLQLDIKKAFENWIN